MFLKQISSWNLRDQHMAETLAALVAHISCHGVRAKVVVWEHNSHLGVPGPPRWASAANSKPPQI